ncbi:hypothetical protein HX773_21235, partial [Pantoea sp. B9002]|uniref:Ig-like domain-containing protein n=1 Tax=Pantoea sp. B9002 TaxID=2726979 RepID=UPI0015A2619D
VTVFNGSTAVGSVTAGADGSWSWQYSSTERFAEGAHALTVRATDPAGNVSMPSAAFTITVDTILQAATITAGTDNVGALTETILRDRVTDDTTPEFHGTAEPFALVILYDNDIPLGSFHADANGNWSWTLPELSPGRHNLTISSSDKAGNIQTSNETYPFQVGQVWDFNDGTFNGWTIHGAHAAPGATFTTETGDGGYQLEFTTPGGANYAADVMSLQIQVEAGKIYDFSFILSRITSFTLINPAQLALTVDGVPVSNYFTVLDTPQKVEGSWTSNITGTVTLAINNLVTTGSGNDFWIDDIAIAPSELAGPVMTFSAPSFENELATLTFQDSVPGMEEDNSETIFLTQREILPLSEPSLFAEVAEDHDTELLINDDLMDQELHDTSVIEQDINEHQLFLPVNKQVDLIAEQNIDVTQH